LFERVDVVLAALLRTNVVAKTAGRWCPSMGQLEALFDTAAGVHGWRIGACICPRHHIMQDTNGRRWLADRDCAARPSAEARTKTHRHRPTSHGIWSG
jgi:hypothetical protein